MALTVHQKKWASTISVFGTSATYKQVGATSGTTGWTKDAVQEMNSTGMAGVYIVADTCFGQVSAADTLIGLFGGLSSDNMDDEPMFAQRIPKPSDSGYVQISFPVYDLNLYQIGMATVSSSDVLTKAWVSAQQWQYQSSS